MFNTDMIIKFLDIFYNIMYYNLFISSNIFCYYIVIFIIIKINK